MSSSRLAPTLGICHPQPSLLQLRAGDGLLPSGAHLQRGVVSGVFRMKNGGLSAAPLRPRGGWWNPKCLIND